MPSSISTVSQLVAVIRAQLSSRPALASTNKRSAPGQSGNKSSAYSPQNLESLIGRRIKSIEPDHPNRGRKAFRVFLESILLSHFGEHLINDPQFYQLVDDIQISMEADPEVRGLVETAIGHLMSSSQ